MSDIAIRIENLSKQYRLGAVGTGTLSHDLNRWWHRVRGKEDPYLKIGETNDRAHRGSSEYVWALRDINLEVKQGEVLGIIGKNGAGKSTLLKILSKVTGPTTGRIMAKGRIASLLEVGTGFHPELTGRENIFLNGAILGMTKHEVSRKLDEIVDFAGVERYLDTPVKRYSSGMKVRLGFAVAAFLEEEILIVDEVLAVGDAEFQKKAIGKMQEVSSGGGRTVLFVSHNMASVKYLCSRAILLDNGKISTSGNVDHTIGEYLLANDPIEDSSIELNPSRHGNGKVKFSDFWIEDSKGRKSDITTSGDKYTLVFQLKVTEPASKVNLGFSIHGGLGNSLCVLYSGYQNFFYDLESSNEHFEARCHLNDLNLAPGRYIVKGRIEVDGTEADWPQFNLGYLPVEMGDFFKTGNTGFNGQVPFLIRGEWE